MFLRPAYYRHAEFRQGMREMLPAAPGLAAWGLMTGVAMVKSGMSGVEASLMTLLVFAGSAQLAAIPLLLAGAPMWVILSTGFCVNLRFVVFSAHLRAYLMHLPRLERMLTGFLTADLSYVLFTRRFPAPGDAPGQRLAQQAYLAGNCCVGWCSWVASSMLGVVMANLIPTSWGLGFAGILALLGIACSLTTTRLRAVSAAVAGAAAVATYALPFKLNILVAIAAAVAVCLLIEKPALPAPALGKANGAEKMP
ncbi:MAG: branched-chain amino acid transporter permease [Polaromonas sp.]|nr:branched-chain amino acid transporter permease [Polaromonas sp.]